jgi:hypothetical protein
VRLSCLARNGQSPGEESLSAAIAVQAIEAQPAFGQIKPRRGQVLAYAEQRFGDVPASGRVTQEAPHSRRAKRNPGVQKGHPLVAAQTESNASAATHRIVVGQRDCRDRDIAVMLTGWLVALIPTERRRIHGATCPWSLPQSVTGLAPGQHSHRSGLSQDRHARRAVHPTVTAPKMANTFRHQPGRIPI